MVTSGDLFSSPAPENTLPVGSIACVKVEDTEPKITWDEEKSFQIPGSTKTLDYYEIPQGDTLIRVQWENQNLAKESKTFSGNIKFPVAKTHVTQKSVFTQKREKLSSRSERTIILNTGFILRAEEDLIDELVDSNFCIIEYKNKYYNAAPVSSQIVKEDNTKDLIAFEIEFELDGN